MKYIYIYVTHISEKQNMDATLTIIEPIHTRRLELFMKDVVTAIQEKNSFAKFFAQGKFNRTKLPHNQPLVMEIATIILENRRLEGTFHLNIFEKTTLHFSVKLRSIRTGYVLTLDWDEEDRMFPPAVIMRTLAIRRIESNPYVFANLDVTQPFDPTLLNTFLTNKIFTLKLDVPLSDITIKVQGNTYTLKYRRRNEAGYSDINIPHLDLTETTIIDSARQASLQRQRRLDRNTEDSSYANPRHRLRSDRPDYPPPYDFHIPFTEASRSEVPPATRPGADERLNLSNT